MARRTRRPPRSRSANRGNSGAVSAFVAIAGAILSAIGYAIFNLSGPTEPAREPAPSEAPIEASAGDTVSGTASVVDGDTLDIHGARIRLVAVDAPESGQKCLSAEKKFIRCGTTSANKLDEWINRNPVSCAIEGKDKYGRLLGQCSVRGDSMQEWLVTNGYALAYRAYSTAFVPAEQKARAARAGVWAGEFVMPWDWRKGARLPGEPPTKAMAEGKAGAG